MGNSIKLNWFEKYTIYKLTPYKWNYKLDTLSNQKYELDKARINPFDIIIISIGLLSLKYNKLI